MAGVLGMKARLNGHRQRQLRIYLPNLREGRNSQELVAKRDFVEEEGRNDSAEPMSVRPSVLYIPMATGVRVQRKVQI